MSSSLNLIGGQQFYANLTAALNQAFSGTYNTQFTLIQYPAQGDFLWNYQNINQVFNQGTFDYISANVSPGLVPGTVQLSASGGFPNAYVQLINKIAYVLGSSDQARLQADVNDAAAEAATLIADYQSAFGPITTAEMACAQQACGAAAVQTPEDYVIGYVLGYVWSGRAATQLPPLTYAQMAAAPDVVQLLPQAPAAGQQVVIDVVSYLKTTNTAATLQSRVQLGNWLVAQLSGNTTAPGENNGGMRTVNPNTGLVSATDQVGYGVGRTLADIQCELRDEARVMTINVAVPAVAVGVTLTDILAPVAGLDPTWSSAADTDASQALAGSAQVQSVTIEYQGYTLVPPAPANWQQQTGVGWYCAAPIVEAYANGNRDVTGFKFVAPTAYNLQSIDEGGNFGLLTGLLISNYPKVTFNYSNADSASLQAALQEWGKSRITVAAGATSSNPVSYSAAYQPGPAGGQPSLTFTPQVVGVPPMQQTAYVIGGTFASPAVGTQSPPIVTRL